MTCRTNFADFRVTKFYVNIKCGDFASNKLKITVLIGLIDKKIKYYIGFEDTGCIFA